MINLAVFNHYKLGLPWWFNGKESTCNAGEIGSVPGLRRSPGGRNGNTFQCSCQVNSMDRGAWHTGVHRVEKIWKRLKPTEHTITKT